MSEVKNEGLEVAAWQARFIETNDWRKCTKEHHDFVKANQSEWPDYEVRQLCRHSEALAGYAARDARISALEFELEVAKTDELSAAVWAATEAVKHDLWDAQAEIAKRDARIATQEAQIKALQSGENSWQSGYDEGRRMGAKHCTGTMDQLRAELVALNAKLDASKFCANVADDLQAELAAAKETITRYETTAENCEVLRAELATPAPIPDAGGVVEVAQAIAWMNTATQEATTYPVAVMDWDDEGEPVESLMTVAQHKRIVSAILAASPSAKGGE